jgi:glutamyl/glutaminyl-tRNA synthetase
MKSKDIRVRIAPSPTGRIHIGNLRTFLNNYLFAKNRTGKFVLRIEDTDQKRKVEGGVEAIIETLSLFGIEFDEDPVRGTIYSV